MKLPKHLLLLLMGLLSTMAFAVEDRMWISHRMIESPESFRKAIRNHIINNHETDHPVDPKVVEKLIEKCNPDKDLNSPETYLDGFDVCMELFVFNLSAGVGRFSIQQSDDQDNTVNLNGTAAFVAGQALFPYGLGSNIALEGKFWYLPNITSNEVSDASIEDTSMTEGLLVYQKRRSGSAWSYRTGIMEMQVPLIDNVDIGGNGVEVTFRSATIAGPLFGLKAAWDRSRGIENVFYADLVPVVLADGSYFKNPMGSMVLRAGYKRFIFKQVALIGDIERFSFTDKDDGAVSSLTWAVGVQLYLF